MNNNEFKDWVVNATAGDGVVYHNGDWALDAPCCSAVYKAAEFGWVALFQRKMGDGNFDYLAIRISHATAETLDNIQ